MKYEINLIMKKYILIIIGILTSISLSAQTAEEYLDSVIEKMTSYDDISIVFNITNIQKDEFSDSSITSSGFASIKGNSYIINMDGQEIICNGETLWTHLIYDEEVMVSEATEDSSPIFIIDTFKENTTMSFVENNDIDIKIIEIKENEGENFEKIQVSINKNNQSIKKIHVFINNEIYKEELVYEITDFKTNQNLPDSMFIFDETQHPNVEVIDMR